MVVEERRRRGWKNRHMRDNIPCREASAVKLAPDHTSKLDAVLVDKCFIQCLLARREEGKKREEKGRGERRERERREREKKEGGGRERSKERSKDRKEERERESPPRAHVQHASVCSFKTPSCEATRRPHVERTSSSGCLRACDLSVFGFLSFLVSVRLPSPRRTRGILLTYERSSMEALGLHPEPRWREKTTKDGIIWHCH